MASASEAGCVDGINSQSPEQVAMTRGHITSLPSNSPGAPQNGQASSAPAGGRSEEHTSELQSLMRISYAVFCLKKKTNNTHTNSITTYDQYKVQTQSSKPNIYIY